MPFPQEKKPWWYRIVWIAIILSMVAFGVLLFAGVNYAFGSDCLHVSKPPSMCTTDKIFPIVEIDPTLMVMMVAPGSKSRVCGRFIDNVIYIRKELSPKLASASSSMKARITSVCIRMAGIYSPTIENGN